MQDKVRAIGGYTHQLIVMAESLQGEMDATAPKVAALDAKKAELDKLNADIVERGKTLAELEAKLGSVTQKLNDVFARVAAEIKS